MAGGIGENGSCQILFHVYARCASPPPVQEKDRLLGGGTEVSQVWVLLRHLGEVSGRSTLCSPLYEDGKGWGGCPWSLDQGHLLNRKLVLVLAVSIATTPTEKSPPLFCLFNFAIWKVFKTTLKCTGPLDRNPDRIASL